MGIAGPLVLLVSMAVSLLSLRWGAMLYLFGSLIFPNLRFGGELSVRFELIFCLWLVFAFFVKCAVSKKPLNWNPILTIYTIFAIVIFVSTTYSLVVATNQVTSLTDLLISYYGIIRPLLVMILFANMPIHEKMVWSILRAFIWLIFPIAFLSIGQVLGISLLAHVTEFGYSSPWRAPVSRLLSEYGFIVRSTGVFESPVYNAVYFLLSLALVWYLLLSNIRANLVHKWVLYLLMGLIILAGVTTLTSTFFLGIIFLILVSSFLIGRKHPRAFFQFALTSLLVVGVSTALLFPYLLNQSAFAGTLSHKIQQIYSGAIFSSRYSSTDGILAGTYTAILERPFLGWGLIRATRDVFVGDSIYVSILYQSGLIGLALFLWLIFSVLKHMWRMRARMGISSVIGWVGFLWTLVFLITGLGSPSFFVLRIEEWYWALVGISLNSYFRLASSYRRYS